MYHATRLSRDFSWFLLISCDFLWFPWFPLISVISVISPDFCYFSWFLLISLDFTWFSWYILISSDFREKIDLLEINGNHKKSKEITRNHEKSKEIIEIRKSRNHSFPPWVDITEFEANDTIICSTIRWRSPRSNNPTRKRSAPRYIPGLEDLTYLVLFGTDEFPGGLY